MSQRGDRVQLTPDLTEASGGVVLLLGKGGLLQVPHGSPQVTFQWMHFPPWIIHNSVLLGQISKDVGDHMSGVSPGTHCRPDLGGMTQFTHSLQVKRNMERAWIRGKGLLSPIQLRNFWLWFHIIYFFADSFYTIALPTIKNIFTVKIDPEDKRNRERRDKSLPKYEASLSKERLTSGPDPFLRSLSEVELQAEFNRPWLAFWLGPFCTLALHLGPNLFSWEDLQGTNCPLQHGSLEPCSIQATPPWWDSDSQRHVLNDWLNWKYDSL